jgi:hypothetical protein
MGMFLSFESLRSFDIHFAFQIFRFVVQLNLNMVQLTMVL